MSKKRKSPLIPDSFRNESVEQELVKRVTEEQVETELVEVELVEGEPKDGWKTFKPKKVEAPPVLGAEDLVAVPEGKPVRHWNGLRVYDCPSCPFDGLDQKTVDRHFKVVHEKPEAPPRGHLVLTDRHGNPK